MSNLDQVVFVIKDGKITEGTIRSFDGYIDETTTPHGVAARLHVRGNELWTWGHAGNFPRMLRTFKAEAEAVEALEDRFADDFCNSAEILYFRTREEAEDCVAQLDD